MTQLIGDVKFGSAAKALEIGSITDLINEASAAASGSEDGSGDIQRAAMLNVLEAAEDAGAFDAQINEVGAVVSSGISNSAIDTLRESLINGEAGAVGKANKVIKKAVDSLKTAASKGASGAAESLTKLRDKANLSKLVSDTANSNPKAAANVLSTISDASSEVKKIANSIADGTLITALTAGTVVWTSMNGYTSPTLPSDEVKLSKERLLQGSDFFQQRVTAKASVTGTASITIASPTGASTSFFRRLGFNITGNMYSGNAGVEPSLVLTFVDAKTGIPRTLPPWYFEFSNLGVEKGYKIEGVMHMHNFTTDKNKPKPTVGRFATGDTVVVVLSGLPKDADIILTAFGPRHTSEYAE